MWRKESWVIQMSEEKKKGKKRYITWETKSYIPPEPVEIPPFQEKTRTKRKKTE